MSNKIEYLKIQGELSRVNKKIGQLRKLLAIKEDESVRTEFEIYIHRGLKLNDELLRIQDLIDSEVMA